MKDLHQPCDRDYGLYIDNGAVNVIGIGTLIESLSALDEFVFRGREFTLEQVRQAVNANFEAMSPCARSCSGHPSLPTATSTPWSWPGGLTP